MKVLVIGNSHVAALKRSESNSHHEVTFAGFSMAGGGFDALVEFNSGDGLTLIENSPDWQKALWLASTGGSQPMIFSHFDAFVVVGLIPSINPWDMTNCPQIDAFSGECVGNRPPISFATYKRASSLRVCIRDAQRLLKFIQRKDNTRPVWFVPVPHMRDDSHEFDQQFQAPARWTQLTPKDREIVELNEQHLYARFFKDYGIRALLPPKALIVDGNRCPARYSIGALGSSNFNLESAPQWGSSPRETAENFVHKNADYGAVWWERLNEIMTEEFANRIAILDPLKW